MSYQTLENVIVSNVICNNVFVDKIETENKCIATLPMSFESERQPYPDVYGRLVQTVNLLYAIDKPLVADAIKGWSCIMTDIPNSCLVTLNKDFNPDSSIDESGVSTIKSGDHKPSVILGLESSCTCICDFKFINVMLSDGKYKDIDIVKISWELMTFEIKGNLILDDIAIITGCPNYG